jgi:predicted NAD/FAD-binding protein
LIEDGHRELSFAGFLEAEGLSRQFVERLILPELATVWSLSQGQVLDSPAGFVVRYLDNLRLLQLRGRARFRSVSGGSVRYLEALSRTFGDRIRLGAAVQSVERHTGGVEIRARGCEREVYEAVVIAIHADQALALLANASRAEREILGQITFRRSVATLHTDAGLLPRNRRAWSSWNFRIDEPDPGATQVTYWLNNVHRLKARDEYLLSLNQPHAVDPAKTIRRLEYRHPVFSAAAVRAQARWAEISGANGTHYAGAYWNWGSHEDGVVSAIRATRPLLSREVPLAPALA